MKMPTIGYIDISEKAEFTVSIRHIAFKEILD